jgi:nucleoside-diphosphate-sugar epimerase
VARILIVGGGCRGRELASSLVVEGHAVRITTRTEQGRGAIEATGAECWIGTPDRLATLRGSLDRVAVLCWLLGAATGEQATLSALFTTRLEYFLTQAIDTTVRGVVYEAASAGAPPQLLAEGRRIAARIAARNQIPLSCLSVDPVDRERWLLEAQGAIAALLGTG